MVSHKSQNYGGEINAMNISIRVKGVEIMKQYSKKLFSLVALCSTTASMLNAMSATTVNNDRVIPFLQWRSEGRDTARKLYGQTAYSIYQRDENSWYGAGDITVQYDQSFRGHELAHCLFGNSLIGNPANTTTTTTSTNRCNDSCDDVLVIQGSQVANKLPMSWMAENFLLPRDFQSAISFSPKVQNVVVNFDLFVGFDRWVNGMYFRLYGPVNWNKASLRAEETVIAAGTQGYAAGFVSGVDVPRSALFTNALQFFGGCQTASASEENVQPLKFAKFSDCLIPGTNPCDDACGNSSQHKTGFAELRGEFGWNYIRDCYRFLLNIQAAAPTGTRPNGEYLFPAQVGNGKHWELGVGLGGAWRMWCDESEEKSFNFIVEADITHLFSAKQKRTFDIKGKPNSRYMLAQKLAANTDLPDAIKLTEGGFQFDGTYAPVANFSTRDVKVSIGVQGDVAAMFNYTVRGFSWDLGYNFWGMSCSKIKLNCDDSCGIEPFPANTWALKGDASTLGTYGEGAAATPVALGATQSAATIFNGTRANANNSNATTTTATNTAINTPVAAVVVQGTTDVNAFGTTASIFTSSTPVFLSIDSLDIDGAQQRGLSHKVFTHFSYTWINHEKWMPFVGAGFSAQFGSHSSNDDDNCSAKTTTNSCDSNGCGSCALSNWAVFVKGGVSFH